MFSLQHVGCFNIARGHHAVLDFRYWKFFEIKLQTSRSGWQRSDSASREAVEIIFQQPLFQSSQATAAAAGPGRCQCVSATMKQGVPLLKGCPGKSWKIQFSVLGRGRGVRKGNFKVQTSSIVPWPPTFLNTNRLQMYQLEETGRQNSPPQTQVFEITDLKAFLKKPIQICGNCGKQGCSSKVKQSCPT